MLAKLYFAFELKKLDQRININRVANFGYLAGVFNAMG